MTFAKCVNRVQRAPVPNEDDRAPTGDGLLAGIRFAALPFDTIPFSIQAGINLIQVLVNSISGN
jgi:hypothetical protein